MTDATQNDEVITEIDELDETTESTEDSSSEVVEAQQKDPSQGAQGKINKLTGEKYRAQREVDALKAENEQLKAQVSPQEVKKEPTLTAPELPVDIYDENAMRDYYQQSAEYNKNIAQQVAADSAKRTFDDNANNRLQQQRQQAQQDNLKTYVETGLSDGLTVDRMKDNEQVIIDSGMKPEVGDFLMQDPNAAKVADYLAQNLDVLEEINQLSPMAAAVKLNSLRDKALQKVAVTNAPDPIEQLQGGGAAESDELDDIVFV